MPLLYRLGTSLYHTAIRLAAATGNPKAKAWVNGRKQANPLPDRLQPGQRKAHEKLIWVHCASLGEWEQGRPVVEALCAANPDYRSVLTFYSPSGYERCKDSEVVDFVTYLPADSPKNADSWQRELRPDLAIFVKYEFWYYHLEALASYGVPTFLVAASFRADQRFFRRSGSWWRGVLQLFTGIITQTAADASLLTNRGGVPTQKVRVGGDPRMDRTLALAAGPFSDPLLRAFTDHEGPTIIAGSVWPDDLKALAIAWEGMPDSVRIVLAPHELHEQELARTQVQWNAKRYTTSRTEDLSNARVLLLDTIGILSRAYRFGDIAYIGGAFRTGLHNTLEPLAYGLPAVFGPHHQKFPEAAAAIAAGGATAVTSGGELREVFRKLLDDDKRAAASTAQQELALANKGAGARTARIINEWMND